MGSRTRISQDIGPNLFPSVLIVLAVLEDLESPRIVFFMVQRNMKGKLGRCFAREVSLFQVGVFDCDAVTLVFVVGVVHVHWEAVRPATHLIEEILTSKGLNRRGRGSNTCPVGAAGNRMNRRKHARVKGDNGHAKQESAKVRFSKPGIL
jgi:hypothetical protein